MACTTKVQYRRHPPSDISKLRVPGNPPVAELTPLSSRMTKPAFPEIRGRGEPWGLDPPRGTRSRGSEPWLMEAS